MAIITTSMHKDTIASLQKLDHSLAKDVIATDDEVDRFNMYIVRQLKMAIQSLTTIKEIGLANARDCLGYRLVTKSVERTADHAVKIAENVLLMKKKLDDNTLEKMAEMSAIAISMFERAIEALFKRDYEAAEDSIERTKDILALEKEAIAASHKIDIKEAASLRLIIESIRRTAEYAADIAEIVLNLTVESVITN
jgi:phosphate uptake regulator